MVDAGSRDRKQGRQRRREGMKGGGRGDAPASGKIPGITSAPRDAG